MTENVMIVRIRSIFLLLLFFSSCWSMRFFESQFVEFFFFILLFILFCIFIQRKMNKMPLQSHTQSMQHSQQKENNPPQLQEKKGFLLSLFSFGLVQFFCFALLFSFFPFLFLLLLFFFSLLRFFVLLQFFPFLLFLFFLVLLFHIF